MTLFSNRQYEQLVTNGSPEHSGTDHKPAVKLYIPGTECTWLLTKIVCAKRNIAWGLYNAMGCLPVTGYIHLNELAHLKARYDGQGVQADEDFEGRYPLSVYESAATICDRISEKEALLRKLYAVKLAKAVPQ